MFNLADIQSRTEIEQLDFHESLGSTNDRAIELIKSGQITSPALILTRNQTGGRGQRARKWWSDSGSLTFSYVFESDKAPSGTLSSLTALAVAESIETQTKIANVEIKWPNDLILNNQKLAGILIESVPVDRTYFTIVGIGINVNNKVDPGLIEALEEHGERNTLDPTSLQMELGGQIDKSDLLVELINRLAKNISSGNNRLDQVNKRLGYRGKPIRVKQASGKVFMGTCHAISNEGELLLSTDNGIQKIFSGSIETIKPNLHAKSALKTD